MDYIWWTWSLMYGVMVQGWDCRATAGLRVSSSSQNTCDPTTAVNEQMYDYFDQKRA